MGYASLRCSTQSRLSSRSMQRQFLQSPHQFLCHFCLTFIIIYSCCSFFFGMGWQMDWRCGRWPLRFDRDFWVRREEVRSSSFQKWLTWLHASQSRSERSKWLHDSMQPKRSRPTEWSTRGFSREHSLPFGQLLQAAWLLSGDISPRVRHNVTGRLTDFLGVSQIHC